MQKKKKSGAKKASRPMQSTSEIRKNASPTKPSSRGARTAANLFAAEATIADHPRKAELRHIPWSSVAVEELNPLLGRQFVVGQNVMLARVLLQKGCKVPEHSHHNEQITYILAGSLKFGIDGKEIIVNAGEVL